MGRVSDAQQAPVMATIAVADTGISRQELMELHDMWEMSLVAVVHALVGRGWVEQLPGRFVGNSGRRPKLAYPSEPFREAFAGARDAAMNLPSTNHRFIYRQAREALKKTDEHVFGSKEFNARYATYLGGTALLAGHYDLKTAAGWFQGEAGWRALVTVDALSPEA